MKTMFAAAIALSLLSGTAMAAPNNAHQGQNQKQTQQVQKQQVQQKTQVKVTTTKVTTNKVAVKHKQGEYSYNGKSYKAVRAPAWHAPKGYEAKQTYHRGQKLPSAFRNRSNVVDYRSAHLNKPNAGYEYVRVNNNVYLVQSSNGLIAQIILSMFL
tara:strand:+ start:214 stop:681 length:468 start_codon:yes stop_codon:yes gene_type:complete